MLITKSKKADVGVLVLVLLTLVAFSATLFLLYTSSAKLTAEVSGAFEIKNAISKQNILNFQIKQLEEIAVLKSYQEIFEEGVTLTPTYSGTQRQIVNFGVFRPYDTSNEKEDNRLPLNEELKSKTLVKLRDGLTRNFKSMQLTEEDIFNINKGLQVDFSSQEFKFSINEFFVEEKSDKIKIEFSLGEIKISLEDLGLASFEEVYNSINSCLSNNVISECITNNLKGKFKASIDASNILTLTSEKKYLLDKDLENVQIKFALPSS